MSVQYVKLGDVCAKDSSNIAQKDLKDCFGKYPVYGAGGYIQNVDFYHQEDEYIAIVKDGAGVGRAMILPAKSSVIGTMQYIIPDKNKVDMYYLYYAIINMALGKYFSGATIPHIYFKDYQKEIFKLPDLETQKKIADNLKNIDLIIAKKNKQIGLFNELVKSRFIEMFGDPVTNSKMWEIDCLGNITTKIGSGMTPRGGKESYLATGVALIRSMNVHDGKFEYKDLAYISAKQAFEMKNVELIENDVLFNITGASVTRTCVVPNTILPARVNQHVAIIRCINESLNPIFLNNLFLQDGFKYKLLNLARAGGATREAITKQQLEDLNVILPPIEMQNQFADFVEQTDKSKLEIQKSLDKLEILKKSLMQKYFG